MMPKVSVLLLRHGQSEWNAIRRWQGLADSPLTDLGRRQAVAVARVLDRLDRPIGRVWSSPLARAAETGEIIAAALGAGTVAVDDRFREADAGEWQGLTPVEIERAYPGYLEAHRRPPTFESFDSVVARAFEAVWSIVDAHADRDHADRDHDGALVVTTHSGVIRSMVRRLGATDARVPNLGGVWLDVVPAERSVIEASTGVELIDRFDPGGFVRTGVDAPGEDPGDQPDHTHADSGAQG